MTAQYLAKRPSGGIGFDATRPQPCAPCGKPCGECARHGILGIGCTLAVDPLAVSVPLTNTAQHKRRAGWHVSSKPFLLWALWQASQLAPLRRPSRKRSSSSNPHRSPKIRCRTSIAEVTRTGRAETPARTPPGKTSTWSGLPRWNFLLGKQAPFRHSFSCIRTFSGRKSSCLPREDLCSVQLPQPLLPVALPPLLQVGRPPRRFSTSPARLCADPKGSRSVPPILPTFRSARRSARPTAWPAPMSQSVRQSTSSSVILRAAAVRTATEGPPPRVSNGARQHRVRTGQGAPR